MNPTDIFNLECGVTVVRYNVYPWQLTRMCRLSKVMRSRLDSGSRKGIFNKILSWMKRRLLCMGTYSCSRTYTGTLIEQVRFIRILPFSGDRLFTHEWGHRCVQEKFTLVTNVDVEHEVYDKLTWHGLRQSRSEIKINPPRLVK